MNCKEIGEYVSGLIHNKRLPPKPEKKLPRAQREEYKRAVEAVNETNQALKMRRIRFLVAVGIISGLTALAIYAPHSSLSPSTPPTPISTPAILSEDSFSLEAGELGSTIHYAEAVNYEGKIEFRNESRLVNLTVAMSRISPQIGTEAGLLQLKKPLLVRFVDNGSGVNTTGGMTGFNPDTGRSISEIIVPIFMSKLEQEVKLPNNPLTTSARENGYLSVLLSGVTLVEISNQAHVQDYTGKTPDSSIMDRIDKTSNLLGAKYNQQVINRQAKPFILVDKIN